MKQGIWRAATWLAVNVVACLIATGCGRNPGSVGAEHAKLFQSADPPTKAAWDTAVAAAGTNGYVTAILTLRRLIADGKLTPEQTQAVQDTAKAVSDQMYAAAARGDASGTNAIAELRKAMGR